MERINPKSNWFRWSLFLQMMGVMFYSLFNNQLK